jgi:hypothetical protein
MSKERELLGRAMIFIDSAYEGKKALLLCDDIQELLAQPEQEPKIEFRGLRLNGGSYSQEPVAKSIADRINTPTSLQDLNDCIDWALTQPEKEPTPCAVSYDDIFDDLKYLIMGFENGADAADYSSEISRARSDMRKARNWLCPLPTNVIDEITKESFYGGVFDFRVFARKLEEKHGIGVDNES